MKTRDAKLFRRFGTVAVGLGLSGAIYGCSGAGSQDGSPETASTGTALVGEFTRLASTSLAFEYHLRTANNQIYVLDFDSLPNAEPNTRVSVLGTEVTPGRFHVDSITQLTSQGDVESAQQALGAPSPRNVAVVLMNFRNNTRQPITPDQARTMVLTGGTSTATYFKEISFGSRIVTGDVFGWVTVNFDDTTCSVDQWGDDAEAKLGVSLSNYQHVTFYFPNARGCGFAGLGQQPGRRTWINEAGSSVFAHEIGHNFGAWHASSWVCPGTSIGGNCNKDEYGDVFDVMGNGYYHWNAYHKGQMGWFDANNTVTSSSGTYDLYPIENPTANLMSVRVPIPGSSDFYYVEYRRPAGFDNFGSGDSVVNGVLIHRAPDYKTGANPLLIDTHPGTTTFKDAALSAGGTFTDGTVSIKLLGANGTSAQVQVGGGGGTPPPPPPPGGTGGPGLTIVAQASNKCVDVSGMSTADATAIQQWDCNGSPAQTFAFTPRSDGNYQIVNTNSGKCLDINAWGTNDGAKLIQWPCTGGANQAFRLDSAPGSTNPLDYVFVSAYSGKCLDINAAGTASGIQLQQWACNGSIAQRFRMSDHPPPNGTNHTIVAAVSNKCVDVSGAATNDGAVIQQWDCNGTVAQQFQFRAVNGAYEIVNANSQACVDVINFSMVDGGLISQYHCTGTPNQLYRLVSAPNAKSGLDYNLVSVQSGKCVDISQSNTATGVQLEQWACNGTDAQRFVLSSPP